MAWYKSLTELDYYGIMGKLILVSYVYTLD